MSSNKIAPVKIAPFSYARRAILWYHLMAPFYGVCTRLYSRNHSSDSGLVIILTSFDFIYF